MSHPVACRGCPFDSTGGTFIPPDKPHADTQLVVWGEAGGDQEALHRRGFVGPSGRPLRRALRMAGLRPGYQSRDTGQWTNEDVAYRNVVLCKPPANRFPGPEIASECLRRHQSTFLKEDTHPWLITGENATRALTDAPYYSILEQMGGVAPVVDPDFGEWTGRWAVVTLHPAYLLHKASDPTGTSQEHLFPHLIYAANKAQAETRPIIPKVEILPDAHALLQLWKNRDLGARTEKVFAIDIEGKPGDPPAITGLSWEQNKAYVLTGWTSDLAHTLRQMMAEATPIPHNAAHDILELDQFGVPIPNSVHDTIDSAALVDPSLKKGLQPQVLSHVLGSVAWKGLQSHTHSVDNQPATTHAHRDWWARLLKHLGRNVPATPLQWYAFYNGLDVAWTLQLYHAHRQLLGRRWDYYLNLMHPLEVPLLAQGQRGMTADPHRMDYHRRACERLEARAARVLQSAGEDYLQRSHTQVQAELEALEAERDREHAENCARTGAKKRVKFSRAKEMTNLRGKFKRSEARLTEGFNGNSPQQRIGLLYDWFGLPPVQGARSSNELAIEELASRIERGTIRSVHNATLDEVLAVLRAMKAASKWSTWRTNYLTLEEDAA